MSDLNSANTINDVYAMAPQVVETLQKVRQMLDSRQVPGAQELLRRSKTTSPWITNAMGVCLLRLGNAKNAVDVFRGLALSGLHFRKDAPAVFKTNYALALMAAGNYAGGLAAVDDLRDESNATVRQIRAAVVRWKSQLTFWERINWYFGGQPDRPLTLDEPLGNLE